MRKRSACTIMALWVLSGCSDGRDEPGPFTPPDAPGEHKAGYQTATAPGPEGLELPVYAWYPARGSEQELDYIEIGAITGSAVEEGRAVCETPRPVVVFSHGNGGMAVQTFSLYEHLARHGFVVAACDHVHNTFWGGDQTLWAALVMRRPLDVAATFDWLIAESENSNSPMAGCLDPAAGYAVMGHSFGGYTTYATAGATIAMDVLATGCEGDDGPGCDAVRAWMDDHPNETTLDRGDSRVWAAVPLAPAWHWVFGPGLSQISVPTLVVGGELDNLTTWDEDVEPSYQKLTTSPRLLAGLEGAGHYSFTDFCPLVGTSFNGCEPDARPPAEVLVSLRTLVLAFLLKTLGEDRADSWLPPAEGLSHWEQAQ